jgi:small-conductance mechanosensitive channel/CRP-like cAMP-binding protein
VEIGWWMQGARVAAGIVRLLVVLENRPRETQIVSDLLAAALYVTTALSVIRFVFDVPIGGLVATSGVVAIILGLALQSTLSDVFSGIAVGLEHAYKPGDLIWVEGGIEGQVLQVNWRSTQIATFHNSIAIVPNSIIAKSRLENRSAPTPMRSVTVTVSTDAAIDPRHCITALDAATKACRLPLADPPPSIQCTSLRGDGTSFDVQFSVGTSREILAARTEMLAQMHRHLRHAGIGLGIDGVTPQPSASPPTLADLMAESDLFGSLAPDERGLLAEHFVLATRERGETLIRESEMPESVILLACGTLEVSQGHGKDKHVLFRASPGDGLGMIALLTGNPSSVTGTALTPLTFYGLNKDSITSVLRVRPGLADSLEAQARRGSAWLRCEAGMHEAAQMAAKPDMLLGGLRDFLRRLNA